MNVYRHIADVHTLQREYSPSTCVADLSVFLRAYAQRSARTRAQAAHLRTFQYGSADAESLDYFPVLPDEQPRAGRPVVVYIHGGYWQELSKNDHSFPAEDLIRQGIGYIAVNYGLAPEAGLAEMVDRCRRALAWIVRNTADLGIDADAIHLCGCSAGAHLAAMTAVTDWSGHGLARNPVRSLTLLSGIFDLRPLPLTHINRAVGMTVAEALCNSPLLLLDATSASLPPTLVVYGEIETSEFKRQSGEFAEAVLRRGGRAELHGIAGRNHFDLIFDLAAEQTAFGSLFLRHIGRARQADHGDAR